jgi:hypothetical protein
MAGTQKVSKFRDAAKSAKCTSSTDAAAQTQNVVSIHLGNIRLVNVTSDVVVSINVPVQLGQQSSSSKQGCVVTTATGRADADAVVDRVGGELLQSVLDSFRVNDWGLFG